MKNFKKKEILYKYSLFVAMTLEILKGILLEFRQIQLKPTTRMETLSTITQGLPLEMEFKSMEPTCISSRTAFNKIW